LYGLPLETACIFAGGFFVAVLKLSIFVCSGQAKELFYTTIAKAVPFALVVF